MAEPLDTREHLKSLKVATVSMAVLLIYAGTFRVARAQLERTLLDIEPKVVALALAEDNLANAYDEPDVLAGLEPATVDRYNAQKQRGQLYAFGVLQAETNVKRFLKASIPGGGTVYFSIGPALPEQQAVVHFLRSRSHPCRMLPGLFYLPVTVHKMAFAPSDIVGPSRLYVFTNQELVNVERDTCSEPGRLRAVILSERQYQRRKPPFMDLLPEELEGEVLRAAARIGILGDDAKGAYQQMRARYEGDTVDLPVVGGTVRVESALIALGCVAVAIQAWISFLLRCLKFKYPEGDAWLIVEPIAHRRQLRGLERFAATFEMLLFAIFQLTTVSGSLLLMVFILANYGQGVTLMSVSIALLTVFAAFFTASSMNSYIRITLDAARGHSS